MPGEITLSGRMLIQSKSTLRFELRTRNCAAKAAGEITTAWTALERAHIVSQPYLGPHSNHVQNGVLLAEEFHTLFDRGYVTITPDYTVRVSSRIRDRWSNGRRYYQYDNPFGTNYEGFKADSELPLAVYRVDGKTLQIEKLTDELGGPNGICFSPDYRKVYVADTGGPREIKVWDTHP